MRPSPGGGSPPRAGRDDRGGELQVRDRAPLGGSGPLLHLPRSSTSSVLVLLVVVLALIFGIVIAAFLAYARYALLGSYEGSSGCESARSRSSPVRTMLRAHFMHVACTFSGWFLTYTKTNFFGTRYWMCSVDSPHASQKRSSRPSSFGRRLKLGNLSGWNTLTIEL